MKREGNDSNEASSAVRSECSTSIVSEMTLLVYRASRSSLQVDKYIPRIGRDAWVAEVHHKS